MVVKQLFYNYKCVGYSFIDSSFNLKHRRFYYYYLKKSKITKMPLSLDRWTGKVAGVTGASSGIGEAIATKLVEHGLKVVGLARRTDRLQSLAKKVEGKTGKFYYYQTDVSKEDDVVKAFAWISQMIGQVHILVNNAGILRPFNFSDFKFEDAKAMLDVNVMGLCVAAREAVKLFTKENINGHIININSDAGHWVFDMEDIPMYNASKYAVTALTESLHLEMRRKHLGTKVTSISPGYVETEIIEQLKEQEKNNPEFANPLKTDDIADAVLYVLSTPPNCQVDELIIRPINVKS